MEAVNIDQICFSIIKYSQLVWKFSGEAFLQPYLVRKNFQLDKYTTLTTKYKQTIFDNNNKNNCFWVYYKKKTFN